MISQLPNGNLTIDLSKKKIWTILIPNQVVATWGNKATGQIEGRILALERKLNERLKVKKYIFANRIYKEFGLPKTSEGSICGWMYDPKVIPRQIEFELIWLKEGLHIQFWPQGVIFHLIEGHNIVEENK